MRKKIKNLDELNAALQQLGESWAELNRLTQGADQAAKVAYDAYQAEFGDQAVKAEQAVAKQEAAIRAFAEQHRDLIPGKSIDLQAGSLSFRSGTSVKYDNEQRVIDRAQDMGLDYLLCYRTTPNKDVLKTQNADTLKKLGVRLETIEHLTIKAGGHSFKEQNDDAKAA